MLADSASVRKPGCKTPSYAAGVAVGVEIGIKVAPGMPRSTAWRRRRCSGRVIGPLVDQLQLALNKFELAVNHRKPFPGVPLDAFFEGGDPILHHVNSSHVRSENAVPVLHALIDAFEFSIHQLQTMSPILHFL